jgi:hypothetical protein
VKAWTGEHRSTDVPRSGALALPVAVAFLSGGVGLTLGWIGFVAYWAVHLLV